VLLETNGKASIIGHGSAYFLLTSGRVDMLEKGNPLSLADVTVQRVSPGHMFDLNTWQADALTYKLSVENGVIHSTQSGGAVY
jgi:cyanophycinase-like exopeptidase